jgi:hypothetical protein
MVSVGFLFKIQILNEKVSWTVSRFIAWFFWFITRFLGFFFQNIPNFQKNKINQADRFLVNLQNRFRPVLLVFVDIVIHSHETSSLIPQFLHIRGGG